MAVVWILAPFSDGGNPLEHHGAFRDDFGFEIQKLDCAIQTHHTALRMNKTTNQIFIQYVTDHTNQRSNNRRSCGGQTVESATRNEQQRAATCDTILRSPTQLSPDVFPL